MYPLKKISCLLLCLFLAVSCQKEEAQSNTLTVGLQCGYQPFEFMSKEGAIVGFDLDVARFLAHELGKKLVIKDMDFDGEILALKQGKIDLIISGMNITASRLKEIAMVPYHGAQITSLSLLFWGQIPEGIHSFQDLLKMNKASISVESGTNAEVFLSKYKEINLKSLQGSLAPLIDVKYGKSLAFLIEPDVANFLMKKHSEITCLPIPLPPDEVILGFGIGIMKENTALLESIEKSIAKLKASKKLSELETTWFYGGFL